MVHPAGAARRPCSGPGPSPGFAVVMDSHTGEILSLADYPTYDATDPAGLAGGKDRELAWRMTSPYEPGSVEKVLTAERR